MIAVHKDLRFLIPSYALSLSLKRLVDITIALCCLILAMPVFLIAAVLVKLTSRGPIFFKQTRCGLNGSRFLCYKFRTMCEDADKKKAELRSKNEVDGPVFKIKQDPRITPVGGFLRQYSIDELPQLWNVLRGDMSLVGPRPPTPDEVEQYQPWHRRRLNVMPGITCIWQTRARNKCSFDTWVKMDLEYIDNWSLSLDLRLLAETIPAVLKGTGC